MLSFVLCDDNKTLLSRLPKMLEKLFIMENIEAEITFISDNPIDTLNYLNSNPIDVLMIDIELGSDITGIDVSRKLREINKDAYVICLSGYMDYVFEALKVKIFDYLLKPISYEKLKNCILRLINDMNKSKKEYLTFGKNKFLIRQDDITYIEKFKSKSTIYTDNNKYDVSLSLGKLETCLPDSFKRCHKSYIVNTSNICEIDSLKNEILFKDNSICPIGLKYKNTILEEIKIGKSDKLFNDTKRNAM